MPPGKPANDSDVAADVCNACVLPASMRNAAQAGKSVCFIMVVWFMELLGW